MREAVFHFFTLGGSCPADLIWGSREAVLRQLAQSFATLSLQDPGKSLCAELWLLHLENRTNESPISHWFVLRTHVDHVERLLSMGAGKWQTYTRGFEGVLRNGVVRQASEFQYTHP